ncbi:tripartite tricarboxylate transporter substrate binding protein [Tumebacillus sp. DT12]|uniref:Tripartite tricarboxylate transporter substrate binding protein n=1 Tax=Tumebacillus lacus TaxID=2995335 RepID=A0ABT3X830_9BACL|nr:tripartite tricarboxylate transporter substrate binding protein [Tumebacillus lacus]MCX7572062.1 tripartite tricarboxylate transporter substrate binding protein [Tumebacillus lacus]
MKRDAVRAGLAALLLVPLIAAGCSFDGGAGGGNGDGYPTKGIEYVVPFAPGGGVDLVARAVSEYASKEWGVPVNVVNKTGGGGAVGAEYALKQAKKDGYTVLADNVSSTSMLVSGMKQPPVTLEDRQLTSRIVLDPIAFAVKADAPWKDMKEFTEWVKAHPDQLTWTSVGPAGTSAFGVADWLSAVGVDFSKTRMVATTGAADSLPKVAGGHATLAVHTVAEVYPLASAGKVKILGVQAEERSPYLPNVPTLKELGIEGVNVKWWTGLTVPKGAPDAVVKKWESTLQKMVKDPAFLEKMKTLHMEVSYQDAQTFTGFVLDEAKYYTELAEARGMRK